MRWAASPAAEAATRLTAHASGKVSPLQWGQLESGRHEMTPRTYRRVETHSARPTAAASHRSVQAARTRAELLHAAATAIGERGYEATSLADITAVLHKPKTALRYHFDTKADIATALLETEFERWETMHELVDDTNRTGLAGLITMMRTFLADHGTGPYQRAAISLLLDAPVLDVALPTPPFSARQLVAEYLIEALEDREIDSAIEVQTASEGIVDATLGVVLRYRLEPMVDLEDKAESIWSWSLMGLGVKRPHALLEKYRAIALPPHDIETKRLL